MRAPWLQFWLLAFAATCVIAAEETPRKEEQFGRKIDRPIPQTYEPLTGPAWSDTFSSEIEAHRQLRKQKSAASQPSGASGARYTISEPQPEATNANPPPAIEETGDGLRIRGP